VTPRPSPFDGNSNGRPRKHRVIRELVRAGRSAPTAAPSLLKPGHQPCVWPHIGFHRRGR
jgi:hypothetical protein